MRSLQSIGPVVSTSCSYTFPHCATCGYDCQKPTFSVPKQTYDARCNTVLSHLYPIPICLTCDTSYYRASDKVTCLTCPSHCYTCSSSATCSSCVSTFVLLTSGGSTLCGCDSSVNKYYDSVTGTCKLCSYWVANCQTCTPSGGSVTCTHCAAGYALVSNVCTLCPANCTICADTTFACTGCSNPTYSIVAGVCRCT
jgi:proprotein convertase subtilisin/kexin type 5